MLAKLQVAHDDTLRPDVVHLDNNNNPFRIATSIIYLTDVPEAARGGTVFPCLLPALAAGSTAAEAAGHKKEAARRAQLCKTAAKSVQQTRGWALSQAENDDPHGLWALSAQICNGSAPFGGINVQPKIGRAIMFKTGMFSVVPGGNLRPGMYDPLLWHS